MEDEHFDTILEETTDHHDVVKNNIQDFMNIVTKKNKKMSNSDFKFIDSEVSGDSKLYENHEEFKITKKLKKIYDSKKPIEPAISEETNEGKSIDTKISDKTRESDVSIINAKPSHEHKKDHKTRKSDVTKVRDKPRESDDYKKSEKSKNSGKLRQSVELRKSDEPKKSDASKLGYNVTKVKDKPRQSEESKKSHETKKSLESKNSEKSKQSDESEKSEESEKSVELRNIDESKRSEESRKSNESKKSKESEKSVQLKNIGESKGSEESKKSNESKNSNESKGSRESEKSGLSKKSDESKKEIYSVPSADEHLKRKIIRRGRGCKREQSKRVICSIDNPPVYLNLEPEESPLIFEEESFNISDKRPGSEYVLKNFDYNYFAIDNENNKKEKEDIEAEADFDDKTEDRVTDLTSAHSSVNMETWIMGAYEEDKRCGDKSLPEPPDTLRQEIVDEEINMIERSPLFPELDLVPLIEITESQERIIKDNLKTMDEYRNYGNLNRNLSARGLHTRNTLEKSISDSSDDEVQDEKNQHSSTGCCGRIIRRKNRK